MTIDSLEPLLQEFEHELFLYPWEIFELRIQEEMIRADRSGCGFGYMEISFAGLRAVIDPTVDERTLWKTVLQCLAEILRGSDIKGFLGNDQGVGLVFLDSDESGVIGCRNRLWTELTKLNWLLGEPSAVAPSEVMKVTHYPLEKPS